MSIRLSIQPKFRGHHSGSPIEGKVIIDTDDEVNLSAELQLVLASYEQASEILEDIDKVVSFQGSKETPNSTTKVDSESRRNVINTVLIYTFSNSKLSKGNYNYYFSIFIPPDLPTKFTTKDCSLTYSLEVNLLGTSITNRIGIDIYNLIPEPSMRITYIGPTLKKLNYHCLRLGDVTAGVLLDRLIIYPGGLLNFQCAVKNCSNAVIDQVTVSIMEYISMKIHGQQRSREKVLMSQNLDACIFTGSSRDDMLQVLTQQYQALEM